MKAPSYLIRTLTLATLSALVVTGCGQQSEESAPVVPSDGGSATAVASASAEGSGEGSAEVSPTAEQAQNYSGGSKAPEGEYRPADEFGPAQNVPRPQEPSGMNIESDEGLEKFLGYWAETVNYGLQTGDFSLASPLISDKHRVDLEYFAWIENLYAHEGWMAGGLRSVVIGEGLLIAHDNHVYTWGGNLIVHDEYVYSNGESAYYDNSPTKTRGIYFEVEYLEGKWVMNGVHEVEGQE